jgi:hypothetical protein
LYICKQVASLNSLKITDRKIEDALLISRTGSCPSNLKDIVPSPTLDYRIRSCVAVATLNVKWGYQIGTHDARLAKLPV